MDFVTFEQWCANQLETAIEQGLELAVPCAACNGKGAIECSCCKRSGDCDDCGGMGTDDVIASEIKPEQAINIFKVKDYFKDMIETFNQLAYSQNKPLIDVIGPFIVYYRKAFQKWGKSW